MSYANKADLYKNQVQRWINRKLKAIELLGGKCVECGYDRYYGALHFHHKNPDTKRWDWSKLRLRSWEDIKDELSNCELLCANCHAEASWQKEN